MVTTVLGSERSLSVENDLNISHSTFASSYTPKDAHFRDLRVLLNKPCRRAVAELYHFARDSVKITEQPGSLSFEWLL